ALVFGRDAARREAFCREMGALLGIEVRPVATAEPAVRMAEVLITATTTREPVVRGEWLPADAHVNAMGSNWADRRELDGAAVRRAALVAVDDPAQARLEAGDLLLAASEGSFDFANAVPLAEIVAGKRPGRERPDAVTLFKSLGIGLEDVTVAGHLYTLAREQGVGEELDFLP
ncbi:MAG TPA: hypothetical protein VGR57_00090, partial [Ktedonobacterales bacterium]|nr:hypothetical protein [Ktedonobacterales bacterium]